MDVFILFFIIYIFFKDLIIAELGSGGVGEVYEVQNQSSQKKMVIKVIKVGTEALERCLKVIEAEIQIGIGCEFLVQLIEFFMEGEHCCVVMEFCSGGDLKKILEKNNSGISQQVCLFFVFFDIFFPFLRNYLK
jgi:serine/threonine protein kinase